MTDYEHLKKIIEEIDELLKLPLIGCKPPRFKAWEVRVKRFLSRKFGENSVELKKFLDINFPFSSLTGFAGFSALQLLNGKDLHSLLEECKHVFQIYLDEMKNETPQPQQIPMLQTSNTDYTKIFIVHGHDEALKLKIARTLEKLGIKPVILDEEDDESYTIIEKFEKHSNVGAAICLLTADDVGNKKSEEQPNKRARQNVIFETGFFMGKLERKRVIMIVEEGVEILTDLSGVLRINKNDWQDKTLKRLKNIGYNIDRNKLD